MSSVSRWFKRDKDQKNRLVCQSIDSTATRVMFDSTRPESKLGVIVAYFTLKTPREDGITGTIIDKVEVEMDLWEANKFAAQLLASIEAATPRAAKPMRRIPFEG